MFTEAQAPKEEKEASRMPRFDTLAESLLSDKAINELPPEDQGRVIADRFIGALVRRGEVKGSQTTYTPQEVLHLMDRIQRSEDLRTITGTDGLRAAVEKLSLDERVGPVFGQLEGQLRVDERGQQTLTSMAQIEGYLQAGGRNNEVKNPVGGVHTQLDDWIPIMLDHVDRMKDDPYLNWMSVGSARELMTSDAPLIKETGRDWQKAILSAEKVGADVGLIGRSAEYIQRTIKAGRDLGSRALLVTTGWKVAMYRDNLERRGEIKF